MKPLRLTLTSIFALSLVACQTTSAVKSADAALFSAIPVEQISAEGAAITQLSTSNPACVSFYKNAAAFAEASKLIPDVGAKAPGGGLGMGLLKTIALGTVAGAASGGIGSLGIGSSFLELALASATSNVVFQGGNTALNAVTSGGAKEAEDIAIGEVSLSPMQQIEAAATKIGCLAPDAKSLGLDLLPAGGTALGGATSDHTHSAGEHTHTTGGHTYSHTH